MLEEFGCYRAHVDISVPSVRTKFVDVPLKNGKLDLSELLSDEVKYEDRTIKVKLLYVGNNYDLIYSNVSNYLHGQRMQIIFEDDPSYFYIGRCAVGSYSNKSNGGGGTIEITAQCDPFKYTVQSSLEDWLWDSFDFEEGYINELANISVHGTETLTLIASKKGYAKVTTDASMNVTYNSTTVTIPVGTTTLYDFEFAEGENTLTFTGTGTISIEYRGGKL